MSEERNLPESSPESSQRRALLEAIIYAADEPVTAQQIAASLDLPAELVQEDLNGLMAESASAARGIEVRAVAGGYKMSTKPEHHEAVRKFVKTLRPKLKLSLPALETLSVIAYKQPVTLPEIQAIRGVNTSGVIHTLLTHKLVTTAGRKQVVGRPMLYKTTKEFLVQFGLKDLSELPTLKELEELSRAALGEGEEAAADQDQPPNQAAEVAQPEAEEAEGTQPQDDEEKVMAAAAGSSSPPEDDAAEPAPEP